MTMCDAMRRIAVFGLLIAALVASAAANARGGTVTYSTNLMATPTLDTGIGHGELPRYDAALFGNAPLQGVSFDYSAQSVLSLFVTLVSYPSVPEPTERGTATFSIFFRLATNTGRTLAVRGGSTGPLSIYGPRTFEEGSIPFRFGPYEFSGTNLRLPPDSTFEGGGTFRVDSLQQYGLDSLSNPKLNLGILHSVRVGGTVSVTYTFAETPEPAGCVLAGLGITILGFHGWRRRRWGRVMESGVSGAAAHAPDA